MINLKKPSLQQKLGALASSWSSWHSQVCFKGKIPKLAFITWLTVQDRLTTRDRLLRWNLPVPATCLLCKSGDESRDHLFFLCNYTKALWIYLFAHFVLQPTPIFTTFLNWIKKPTTNRKLNAICKLVFHVLVYFIWRECNSRLHSALVHTETQLKREIHLLLRRRLAGLDRTSIITSNTTHETYLYLWFANFQHH